jgi:hypothetical protein
MRALALALVLTASFAEWIQARLVFDPSDPAFTVATLVVFDRAPPRTARRASTS